MPDDALKDRVNKAMQGDIIEGGVVSAREAAAFVSGYLLRRFLPSAKGKALPSDARAKIQLLATQFLGAYGMKTDADAARAALAIGESGAVAALRSGLTTIFDLVRTGGDTDRGLAISVLHHAAALAGALGAPIAAQRFAQASGVTEAQAVGVLPALAQKASDAVAAAANLPADAGNAAKAAAGKAATAAVNAAGAAIAETKAVANASLAKAENAAKELAASGQKEIAVLLADAKQTAEAAGAAINKAAAQGGANAEAKIAKIESALAAKMQTVGASVSAEVAKIEAVGTTAQKEAVVALKTHLQSAMGTARDAAQGAAGLTQSVRDAGAAGVKIAEDKLAPAAREALALPGKVAIGIGVAGLLAVILIVVLSRGRAAPLGRALIR